MENTLISATLLIKFRTINLQITVPAELLTF